ncbi:MAG: hypothetical protein Q7T78_17220 [Rhodoferax sp.]|nr:hypothetical protein [Rhodoferax sp.]
MSYEIFNTCVLVPGVTQTNCAGWVQAWGSIIAIVFAAWIAGKDDRRRHREAVAIAKLASPRVMHMAGALRGVTKGMCANFTSMSEHDGDPRYFWIALNQLNESKFPTDEQVQRISALAFSQDLAEGIGAVDLAIFRLTSIEPGLAKMDSAYRKVSAKNIYNALIYADIKLEQAVKGYAAFTGPTKPQRGKDIILTPLKPLIFIESVKAAITGRVARIKRKLIVRN